MKNVLCLLLMLTPVSLLAQWQGTNPVYVTAGNVGIGVTNPQARLSFPDMPWTTSADGITWYSSDPLSYGIYRTAGSWTSPTWQQLRVNWGTGIILDPGSGWAYTYVDIRGGGLRVSSGDVGIGTTSTTAKLDVLGPATGTGATIRAGGGGDVVLAAGGSMFFDGNYSYGSGNYIRPVSSNTQAFITAGLERMRITGAGYIGIGTTNPDQRLTVNGTVHATRVKVETTVPGPDYVFEKDYILPSLGQIKSYIDENKHLPGVPSAKEMEAKGIDVGEMNMLLLKKIEEMTLYMIEQERRIKTLEEKVK
jgi:hypothetical protein